MNAVEAVDRIAALTGVVLVAARTFIVVEVSAASALQDVPSTGCGTGSADPRKPTVISDGVEAGHRPGRIPYRSTGRPTSTSTESLPTS